MENKSNQGLLEEVFHLSENRTDIKIEVIAGITASMTIAYILVVSPNILGAAGMDRGAVFAATALASPVATLLMAALADYPFVLAPGMGLNIYFTYTVVPQVGYTWQMALAAVFMKGLISIALSLTSVREAIFNAIPMNLEHAVSADIELFIAFIGLQNAEIVVENTTLVFIFSFKGSLDAGTLNSVGITVLLVLIGAFITGILVAKNIRGNILWGTLIAWVLDIICEVIRLYQPNTGLGMFSVLPDFSSGFGIQSMAPIFFKMDFSDILSLNFVTITFAFLFVDMFSTLGTLVDVASKADMLDKDGKLPKIRDALLSDAINTSLGAVFGASATTTFVESASSIAEDGGTGLTSVVAAVFFGLSLFLSPIFLAIPSFATTPALTIVSFLMISSILKIDFDDFTEVIPSYIAIIATPLTYNISEGIAMGIISYVVIGAAIGHAKEKEISPLIYILAILFVLKYVLI